MSSQVSIFTLFFIHGNYIRIEGCVCAHKSLYNQQYMRPKDTYPLMDELNSAKKLSIDQFWDVLMKFGFKKGSKSRNETKELFLDIKPIEGHLFARKEQALKAVDIIDILKRKKLFHPSLQVFIVEESGIYQLAFIQKALLNGADDQFHSLNHKDPITNNLNTQKLYK